jgi:hypothetical protein
MTVHLMLARGYPDVGTPCCMGSAAMGPGHCTCWTPVYDQEQEPPQAGPMLVRSKMCADCAFRSDSPERSGDERYEHAGEDGIEETLEGAFVCHQGMRRLLREEHPTGAVLEAMPGAYEPGHPPRKADGSPPDYCAGWAAARAKREI